MKTRPDRDWTVYIIHHSHTDIGYTDHQSTVSLYHAHFIQDALDIIKRQREQCGKVTFKWNCETFWAVEAFWKQADDESRARFVQEIREGNICLSANYLNMTELADDMLLRSGLDYVQDFAEAHELEIPCALTADINGYGWGFSEALCDYGVRFLFSCVHAYHGLYPLYQKQRPFWWRTPSGKRMLVWNGDHYNLGNELGLAPGAFSSFLFKDRWSGKYRLEHAKDVALERIGAYLLSLEQEDYPFDFVPVPVSGLFTDNAPPNERLCAFADELNSAFGGRVQLKLATLDELYQATDHVSDTIPEYVGDWPDWWSDGVASTPSETRIFRSAQRTARFLRENTDSDDVRIREHLKNANRDLLLFAEHTWGHSHSVSHPWLGIVHELGSRKRSYAVTAHEHVHQAQHAWMLSKGWIPRRTEAPLCFRVINPFRSEYSGPLALSLDYWEADVLSNGGTVRRLPDNSVVPHLIQSTPRGKSALVCLELEAEESQLLHIAPDTAAKTTVLPGSFVHPLDRVYDVTGAASQSAFSLGPCRIESPQLVIEWNPEKGIHSLLAKTHGENLVSSNAKHGICTPVYEYTPADPGPEIVRSRQRMGRNRKGLNVVREYGRLTGVQCLEQSESACTYEFMYHLNSVPLYAVVMTVYAVLPRIDIRIRYQAPGRWQAENLYISLPFTTGDIAEEFHVDKDGAIVRPGIDQLPGTCVDFACVQEGVIWTSPGLGVALATPDTPLIQFGPLSYEERALHSTEKSATAKHSVYAWVMTTFWDTNFAATVDGFHECRFSLSWKPGFRTPEVARDWCRISNTGLPVFRVEPD